MKISTITFALLLGASTLFAQVTVTSVEPADAAVGTPITIHGSGFGTKKPSVFLLAASGSTTKKTKLKVTEFGGTTIVAVVKKAKSGTFSVNVKPKGLGAQEPGTITPLEIHAPSEIDVPDDVVAANSEITVDAAFLGSKKGKVRIGGVKSKVLAWEPDAYAVNSGFVRVRVPKKLTTGSHAVEISNIVGSGTSTEVLPVEGTPPGASTKPSFFCLVDGKPFQVNGKQKVGYDTSVGCFADDCISIGGLKGKTLVQIFIDNYEPLVDGPRVMTYENDPWIAYATKALSASPNISLSHSTSIEITHVDAEGRVSGTFSATNFSIETGNSLLADEIVQGTFSNVPLID